MHSQLYNFILKKQHHAFRHRVEWNLAEQYEKDKLSPIERIADRFDRLCNDEQAVILDDEQIVFLRTVENLPPIFTEKEWADICATHYIHELGFMSNVSPNY